MSSDKKLVLIGDVRRLLHDVVTSDMKALAVSLSSVGEGLERVHRRMDSFESKLERMDAGIERSFDRSMEVLDLFKDVQELKEFRIRMEERQKPSEAAH